MSSAGNQEHADWLRPGRLWSLWEIMQTGDWATLVQAVTGLASAKQGLRPVSELAPNLPFLDSKGIVEGYARKLREAAISIGLPHTLKSIDRLIELYDGKYPLVPSSFIELVMDIQRRLRDELSERIFLSVTPTGGEIWKASAEPFGPKVSNKFPKAIGDISEAAKCLALERPTASVFHLMRVMENAVQRFGRKLKVPINVEVETWYRIMGQVNKGIANMKKGSTAAQQRRNSKFAVAGSSLDTVRIAWRNEVMHPKATYTMAEAEDVFRNVKAFMNALADII